MKYILKKTKTDLIDVPPGCTSRVQPLGVILNKLFKDTIGRLFEQHINENLINYTKGKITASKRTVLITKWIGTAWSKISKEEDMKSRSFKKSGITLALDETENANLNIEGLEDYEMPSAEEAYEFQLQSGSSSYKEEQDDSLFYFILSVLRF